MVTTRAQEASASQATGTRPFTEPPEANRFAPPPARPHINQEERIDLLFGQMQELVATVQGLQEQRFANNPAPSPPPRREDQGAGPAPHGRTPPETSQAPLRTSRRKASKRRRSSSRHGGRSPGRHDGKEPRSVHSLPRRSSSPSEASGNDSQASSRSHRRETSRRRRSPSRRSKHLSERHGGREAKRGRPQPHLPSSPFGSSEDSHHPKVVRRAERRLDRYRRRLDELTRRITDPQEGDYDRRPPCVAASRSNRSRLASVCPSWTHMTAQRTLWII